MVLCCRLNIAGYDVTFTTIYHQQILVVSDKLYELANNFRHDLSMTNIVIERGSSDNAIIVLMKVLMSLYWYIHFNCKFINLAITRGTIATGGNKI